jgi:hypothetical protein
MTAHDDCRDMMVRLYALPDVRGAERRLSEEGIGFRRALAPEKHVVLGWLRQYFWDAWVSECDIAFCRLPIACILAVSNHELLGVSVYDSIALGVAGPIAVHAPQRGNGLGAVLAVKSLEAMRNQGYSYAVLGCLAPGARRWIARTVKAQVIEDSSPATGMYRGLLIEQ